MEKRRIRGVKSLWLGVPVLLAGGFWLGSAVADGWNNSTRAPNELDASYTDRNGNPQVRWGGIANTRHNLTMSYMGSSAQGIMGPFRNNYYEVCVYCHTPHGANSTAAAPLWNRTVAQRTYTLYDNSSSMTGGQMSQPGPNSLTCLSCHDGVTAIDSIINMPTQLGGAYRAGYNASQQSDANKTWLNNWGATGNDLFERTDEYGDSLLVPQPNANTSSDRPFNGAGAGHSALAGFGDNAGPCITCHQPGTGNSPAVAPSFDAFLIGNRANQNTGQLDSDGLQTLSAVSSSSFLADDHPIGVQYPKEFGPDKGYNEPDVKKPKIAFWDLPPYNGHADPNEIRVYDTGEGYEVECGSCHDPHGVGYEVSDGSGDTKTAFIPSFLRVGETTTAITGSEFLTGNTGSKLCLTCHVK